MEVVAYLLGRLLRPFGCDFGVGHCYARGGEVRCGLLRGCKRSWWEGRGWCGAYWCLLARCVGDGWDGQAQEIRGAMRAMEAMKQV